MTPADTRCLWSDLERSRLPYLMADDPVRNSGCTKYHVCMRRRLPGGQTKCSTEVVLMMLRLI